MSAGAFNDEFFFAKLRAVELPKDATVLATMKLCTGKVAVRRTIETFPDPRLIGLLPADAAPQLPLLASRI